MPHATNIEWPNREKASSKLLRLLVIVALLVSTALILIVSIIGWGLMQEAKAFQIVFIIVNLIFIAQVVRWSRGVLPMSAGIATLIAIFAGVSIPSWYARDATGYDDAALSATIGFLTIVLLIVQFVVIVLAIIAFTQNWQIEVESHHDRQNDVDGAPRRRGGTVTA